MAFEMKNMAYWKAKNSSPLESSPAKQTKFPESEATKKRRKTRQGKYREILANPETDLTTWKGTRKKFVKSGGKGFGK